MVAFKNALVAAIATFGAVQAYPQAPYPTSAGTPTPPPTTTTPDPEQQALLFRDLFSAPTAIKRFQRLLTAGGESLLSGETLRKLVVFDFNDAKPAKDAKGGATKAADIESFPILTELGISTTLGFLDACGINTPHVHPRATEFLTVVEGSVKFGYILENGLVKSGNQEIAGTLDKFQGTVFPMGSIHYQFNPTCDKSVFVATLNDANPGTLTMAQAFLNLDAGVINATLGFPKTIDGKNIEEFRKLLPVNIAQDIDNCLAACKNGAY